MDMLDAPFVNHEFPLFDPAFVSPELSGNVPTFFDPPCACSHIDSSEPSTAHSNLSVPGQERYVEAAFGIDSNGVGDFCACNCGAECAFSQPWQVSYESVEGIILQNAVTQHDMAHTASTFETWSPMGTSASYSSAASPSAPWDETGRNNFSTIMPGFPVQSDHQPDGETEPISPERQKAKKKRDRGPAICPVCSKVFDKPCFLREHMREHGHQYTCSRCQQTFAEAGNLAMHMKMHDAGPYVCRTCTKVFLKAANYRRHLKCHDENRQKRKCPEEGCDKTYSFAGCLNRHIKSHYADYRCGDCDKFFNRSDLRDRHQGKHCQKARERRAAEDSLLVRPLYARTELSQVYHQADEQVHVPVRLQAQAQAQAQNLIMHQQPSTAAVQGLMPEHHMNPVQIQGHVQVSTPPGLLQQAAAQMGHQAFVGSGQWLGVQPAGYGL